MKELAPYGYCPVCGHPGQARERRMNGDDSCVKGHTYPSVSAIEHCLNWRENVPADILTSMRNGALAVLYANDGVTPHSIVVIDSLGQFRERVIFPDRVVSPPVAIPVTTSDSLVSELRDRHIPWSRQMFGDGMRTIGICKHIEKELNEIRENPFSVEEWIDVAILALDGAWRTSASAESVVVVLFEKLAKIRTRTYPKPASDDEPSEHVRHG